MSPDNLGLCSKHKAWWRHVCSTTNEEHVWQSPIRDYPQTDFRDARGHSVPFATARPMKSLTSHGAHHKDQEVNHPCNQLVMI